MPTTELGNDALMNYQGSVSSLPDRLFIDEPRIITDLETDFCEENRLRTVCCLSDEEIWTCGNDNLIRLYDLEGELQTDIPTHSGNMPTDIAVTKKKWKWISGLYRLF